MEKLWPKLKDLVP
jgi:hypothetical protein